MIELTKSEVKFVSGGAYYTVIGAIGGGFAMSAWLIMSEGKNSFTKDHMQMMTTIIFILGSIGVAFGSVVGYVIDNAMENPI